MNGVLKTSAQAIPRATIYRVAGTIAVLAAALSVAVSTIFHPYLGTVVLYAAAPFVTAMLIWAVAFIARLRLVGFLPSACDHFIPPGLRPWLQFWLMFRFGLLGSILLLLVIVTVSAVLGGPIQDLVAGVIYLIWLRLFVDVLFGAAFNIGVISRRHATP